MKHAFKNQSTKTISILCFTAGILMLAGSLNLKATDGVWTNTSAGSWSTAANWTNGVVADGAGNVASTASFNALDLSSLSGSLTVTLDTARTNGNLIFANLNPNSSNEYILAGSNPNNLFLAGPNPTITVSNTPAGTNVTISCILVGTNGFAPGGLTINGGGQVNLTGANVYTNVLVNGSTLGVSGTQSAGVNSTNSTITLENGATLFTAASFTAIQGINVQGTDYFSRPNGLSGGNWNGMFTGNGTLWMNLEGNQMTFGGGNSWNSNLFANFTGTIILTNGGNMRFDVNNGTTLTFGSRFATFDLGQTNNGMNERGATGIATHTTYVGALKGGPATSMSCNGTSGTTNTFQIGDANLTTLYEGQIKNGTPTAVTKSGTGTLFLDHTNDNYSGPTTILNGSLALTNGGALTATIGITIISPGIFDISGVTNLTDSPWSLNPGEYIGGNGTIQCINPTNAAVEGSLVLTNGTVNAGVYNGSFNVGTLTVNGNLSLSNTAVVFGGAAPSNSLISVNGNLNLASTNIVQLVPNLANSIITNGVYPLFQWTGSLTGGLTNLVLTYPAQPGSITLQVTGSKQIVAVVTGGQLTFLIWNGNQGSDWQAANNWLTTNGTPATWSDVSVAIFNDAAATRSVTLSGAVFPANVIFNNTSTYDVSGSGSISGTGALVQNGTGKTILETANSYNGTTTISNGVLQVGNGNASGSVGSGAILDNGVLVFDRPDSVTYGSAIAGTGGMTVSGGGTLTLQAGSSYTGNTLVTNSSTLYLGDGSLNGSVLGTVIIATNSTLHYNYNSANSYIINNNLAGAGTVYYQINSATTARSFTMGATATNTAFTGNVIVQAARLEVPTAFGMPGTNITCIYDSVVPASVYAHGGSTVTNSQSISIYGNGPTALVDSPAGFGSLRLNNGWSGLITIAGVDVNNNMTTIGAASGTATIIGNITDNGAGYELQYYGGTIQVGPTNGIRNTYGITRVAEQINSPNTSQLTTVIALNTNAFSTNTLNMNGQATFELNGNNLTFNDLIDESVGSAVSNFPPHIVNGSTTASAVLTVGGDNGSDSFYGILGNGGSQSLGLTKTGTGTLTLGGDNTNTGPVTVAAGTLLLAPFNGVYSFCGLPVPGTGSFSNSTLIAVSSGAILDVSGRSDDTLTLNNGQTVKGSGTVNGKLIANTGSTVFPGDTIGTLNVSGSATINGTLLIGLNRTNPVANCSHLAAGSISYTGTTLSTTNIGLGLKVGDTFPLFGSGTSGFAAVNLQTNDYANNLKYTWNNSISLNGQISVATVSTLVNANPTNLNVSVSGGNVILSWPADHTGWTLQDQTNNLGVGLSTNWVNVPGSSSVNAVTNTINPGNGAVFYRMIYSH